MEKEKIILIGGGGHCLSCIDVIELQGKFDIVGIIDKKEKIGEKILNYPIIGTDDDLERLSKEYSHFFITIGQIKSSETRIKLYEKLKSLGKKLPIIISPLSYFSKFALIEEGTIIMHHAIVNTKASISANCIINTKALIEHEATIGEHCHISTGAIINGQVNIGKCTFVGSRVVINNNIEIANNVVIGAGSTVIKNIEESGTYLGTPAKKIK